MTGRHGRLLGPVLLLAVSCGGATSSPSGIRGTTVVDAGCPPLAEASSCPTRPLAARIEVTPTDGEGAMRTVRSGADGTFLVELEPGEYQLRPIGQPPSPEADPVVVQVRDGEFSTVTIQFDSGVR